MQEDRTLELLALSREGNKVAREEIIQENKTFIVRISSKICGRYLSWENDDELSIALIAFNEAIDRYKRKSDQGGRVVK